MPRSKEHVQDQSYVKTADCSKTPKQHNSILPLLTLTSWAKWRSPSGMAQIETIILLGKEGN